LVDCVENSALQTFFAQISPQPLYLSPTLKHLLREQKNQLSNARLRSRNGGVGAEICLRKVK